MAKEWFIQFQNYHKGPFNQDEIVDLWQRGKIVPQQMLWRRGMTYWQPFECISELSGLFPPEHLPGAEPLMPTTQEPQLATPVPLQQESPRGGFMERALFFIFLLLAALGGVELWRMNNQVPRPQKLAVEAFSDLKEVLKVPLERGVEFRFAFDSEVNRLWVASNLNQQAKVTVRLEALSGKVLSLNPVGCQGEGVLQRHFANIDSFVFHQGSQFYPGYYRVYLSYGSDGSSHGGSNNSLRGGASRSFSDVVYLGPGDREGFASQLQEYKDSMSKTFTGYTTELAERYSTLSMLLGKTESLFKERLGALREGREITYFERDYSNRIGPLLTEFAADNFSRPKKVPSDLSRMQRQFDILFDLSKSLANLTAEIVQTVKPKGRLPSGVRQELLDLFSKKFSTLKGNVLLQEKKARSLQIFP